VIAAIRAAASADAAKTALQAAPFDLSERQAQAVLDMQLRRLAQLEASRIQQEFDELMKFIDYLVDLLAHPEKIDALIKEDCADLKETYGDERRTQVFDSPVEDISEEDLVAHAQTVVTISDRGYMKRVPLDAYRIQRRGGRGVTGQAVREEDAIRHLIVTDTHASLLLFTDSGKVFSLKAYEVPEASRQARGIPVPNLVAVENEDRITAIVSITDFNRDSMILCTEQGTVKRTPLEEFASVRRPGLIAMRLDDGDRLIEARPAAEDDDAVIVTSDGQAMRFTVGSLRVASRSSGGVRGIKLRGDARVIALAIDVDGEDLLVVSRNGAGKRTPIEEYPSKGRGGMGVKTFNVNAKTGPLAVARAVNADHELILVSQQGIVMRTGAGTISRQGRSTQGVQVMNVDDGDHVASVARVDQAEGDPDGHDAETGDTVDVVIDATGTPEVSGEPEAE
jgi:DNA gyrase subunit A